MTTNTARDPNSLLLSILEQNLSGAWGEGSLTFSNFCWMGLPSISILGLIPEPLTNPALIVMSEQLFDIAMRRSTGWTIYLSYEIIQNT